MDKPEGTSLYLGQMFQLGGRQALNFPVAGLAEPLALRLWRRRIGRGDGV